MRFKGLLITVVVVVGLLFAVLNWRVLFAPTRVNLLLDSAEVPLGITLLLFAVGLALAFFLASLWERAGQLRQVTHQERLIEELRARLDRQRAEELEALQGTVRDRFDALQQQLERDSDRVEASMKESLAELEARLVERLGMLQERVLLVRNELAADIGELEDRMQDDDAESRSG